MNPAAQALLLPARYFIPLFLQTAIDEVGIGLRRMRRSERGAEQACEQSPDRATRSPDQRATPGRTGDGTADRARGGADTCTSSSTPSHTAGLAAALFRTRLLSQLLARFNILLCYFFPGRLQTRIGIQDRLRTRTSRCHEHD